VTETTTMIVTTTVTAAEFAKTMLVVQREGRIERKTGRPSTAGPFFTLAGYESPTRKSQPAKSRRRVELAPVAGETSTQSSFWMQPGLPKTLLRSVAFRPGRAT
jgi:hypothetical protein